MNTATLAPSIPKSAMIFGWILVAAGTFFAYVYMVNPGIAFPGISIGTVSEQFGLYSTGVRILGSVLGIILALYFNSAALLALMLATRVFIELGDVTVGLIIHRGTPDANTLSLCILAALEIFFVVMLVRRVKKIG
jgi:hypothetical protein